ncbi:DNA ligase, NAD-dependent [Neorickettsia risticii str. Illinois]|uniref:DNA ligase n=1 Tax=Neorickettsia risticii (strain Illinois) TaxID=434131 RepID=C6V4Y8_NEORI|nr:NAD-dependent DNA ligase LigA [Neorickettsia risticii]ACT69426.1 DNA ligase, NAD-dependent [Neorickettsia risticii str. Illinois]
MKAKKEIQELYEKLLRHNKKYYQDDSPEITDAEYDSIKGRYLKLLEANPSLGFPVVIGYPASEKFQKVKHLSPMLSLRNIFSEEELVEYIERTKRFLNLKNELEFLCEPKIDGVSFSARYINGKLLSCATRGDGKIGENIIDNMKVINGFPIEIVDVPDLLEVRGEVFLDHDTFQTLEGFSNPRNAAAGSLRQLNPEITKERNLQYFAYSISKIDGIEHQEDVLHFLSERGFMTNPLRLASSKVPEIMSFYDSVYRGRSQIKYDIDGLVYKVNNLKLHARLGTLSDAPRWAIAHKFPSHRGKTILEKIKLSVGRTGIITPVAHLKPITIGGVVISRASLYNEDELARKDIREGDLVTVERAGDVIPKVLEVDISYRTNQERFIFPDKCPSCSSTLIRKNNEAAIRCNNRKKCTEQVIQQIKHLVSAQAFDIDGIGTSHISFFIEKEFISEPADIFCLDKHRDEIKKYDGWGEKSVDNILTSIEKSRKISLEKFIFSLGIKNVGEKTAYMLAQQFKSFANWFDKMSILKDDTQTENEIRNLDGMGSCVCESLLDFFSDPDNCNMVKSLSNHVMITDHAISIGGPLSGKKFVFTGTLLSITREEAKEIVKKAGGIVLNSVSKQVDYVVAGEKAGSKLVKANELGIAIIEEKTLIEFTTGNNTPALKRDTSSN